MSKIEGPAPAVALGNEWIRIVAVVVKEAIPVAIVVAEYRANRLTLIGNVRLRRPPPKWQKQDDGNDEQQSKAQHEKEVISGS